MRLKDGRTGHPRPDSPLLSDGLLAAVERNARIGAPARQPSLSAMADMLGARGSAAAASCLAFEAEGVMPIAELARKLGCHQRSLERKLKAEGLTAESLRQAVRMIRATDRLGSSDSLTTIAIEEALIVGILLIPAFGLGILILGAWSTMRSRIRPLVELREYVQRLPRATLVKS